MKKLNASTVLQAARRRHGKTAFVRHNKHAVAPAERLERVARIKEIVSRIKELEAARTAMKHDWGNLLKAAEFVRDVQAQEPSLSQLGEAATMARQWIDICADIRLFDQERNELRGGLHSYRWEAGYYTTYGIITIHEHGDTLEQLMENLEDGASC